MSDDSSSSRRESLSGSLEVWTTAAILIALSVSTTHISLVHAPQGPSSKSPSATITAGASFGYASQWGSYGGPIAPNGVAVDSSGNIFVADSKNYQVDKFAANGSFIASWGSYGIGSAQFRNPEGIAVDSSGGVFVSDAVNNNIQKFSNTGTFIASWNTWNKTNTLKQPLGLSLNSTGFVFAADSGDQRVQIYRNNGTYVGSLGALGSNVAGKFQSPFGVANGPMSVFVTDSGTGNVTEFTPAGTFVCTWAVVLTPQMAAADLSSNIYVADGALNHVVKVSPCSSTPLWASPLASFLSPVGVAVDGHGNLFVGDSGNFRVQRLSASSGIFLSSLTYPRPGLFDGPHDVALDGIGHIYVVDFGNNRIQEFSLGGVLIRLWGTTGNKTGDFSGPEGITIDHSGSVYVSDSGNNRVEKFLPNGTFLKAWGTFGTVTGKFIGPFGVAVDSSNDVYVTDNGNDRVEKFDSLGNFLLSWGSTGIGNGLFKGPTGIAVDGSNNVYVVDSGNSRVEKFSSSGAFLAAWGSSGPSIGQLNNPGQLSLDPMGNVFVADTFNDRVEVFTGNGTFLTTFGTIGSGNGSLVDPEGLAVDSAANVFVADTGGGSGTSNNRIEVFAPSGSVGGTVIPVDTMALVILYLGSVSVLLATFGLTAMLVRRKRCRAF